MAYSEEIDFTALKFFYEVLRKSTEGKLKKKEPLFFQIIESTSGNRSEIIRNSRVNINYEEKISPVTIEKLLLDGYISKMECDTCYSLSAKGLFAIEEHLNLIDISILLDLIQKKYFTTSSENAKLTDIEKIVIFVLLSSRSFSIDACMNIESLRREGDVWLRIFQESASLLEELGSIVSTPKKLYEKEVSGELSISFIMKRVNNLPEKTMNLYRFNKKGCYYLDLKRNTEISTKDMTKLFRKIFDQTLTMDQLTRINQFFDTIVSKEIIRMSEYQGSLYCSPKLNIIMETALNNVVLDKK